MNNDYEECGGMSKVCDFNLICYLLLAGCELLYTEREADGKRVNFFFITNQISLPMNDFLLNKAHTEVTAFSGMQGKVRALIRKAV